ncbi:ATP-NAD kinase family protein [Natrinema versiforme]|uniref:ATP-NAD/AcoX kinase n=1 Tax=Natrinema versiforme JCM 10478 TaxID=1227496 RepID=L9YBY3_9EURY|nr:ATP-NAD kinase family protein [Natrinema versiforme]ELY70428.1 ATP-NAD/AcoX kinase [Natrinema versiforme JCM 10478]
MESIGVVVNPIAGMGGRVGLKGTDGNVAEARRRGAEPRAPDRAREALRSLHRRAPDLTVYTAAGAMGERAVRDAGYEPAVVYEPADADASDTEPVSTTADDTRAAVRALLERGHQTASDEPSECTRSDDGVDLVFFVGGDGTAVDVAEVLEAAEGETPMLGVPAGVKIYSSVFGVTPADAGRIAAEFDRTETREVNDIDEDAYREGEVRTELKAVVPVPVAPAVQSSKQVSSGSVESLATGFAREVEPSRTYVFGPGGTVGAIEEELGIDPSPLGVDVWRAAERDDSAGNAAGANAEHGELLAHDAAESDILEVLTDPVTIVVSPIGGQGFVFGRGNHQISPAVIRRADEIAVVAAAEKLDEIDSLRVDTDDEEIDEELRGWLQVRTGRFTTRLVNVV